jgi:hypothetical protein
VYTDPSGKKMIRFTDANWDGKGTVRQNQTVSADDPRIKGFIAGKARGIFATGSDSGQTWMTKNNVDSTSGSGTGYLKDINNLPQNIRGLVSAIVSTKGVTKAQAEAFVQSVKDNGRAGINTWAINNIFTGTEKNNYTNNMNASEGIGVALDYLDTLDTTSGPYKALAESAKPWLLIEKDQKYVKLNQAIQYNQATIKNKLYGAALTEGEQKYADTFLVNDTDSFATIENKLNGLKAMLDWANDAKVAVAVGAEKPKLSDYITAQENTSSDQYAQYRSKVPNGEILVKRNGVIGTVPQTEYDPKTDEKL